MKLNLQSKKKETGDAVTFIWLPSEALSWRPGQFLEYTLDHQNADDRGIKRYFTIASAPYEGFVQQTTRIIDKRSSFKNALNDLPLGGSIEATGPKGDFIVDDPDQYIIMIAGGIGITPYRSILLQSLKDKELFSGVLLYQNKDQDFVFREVLENYAKSDPNFHLEFLIDKITPDLILEEVPSGTKPYFYISGPEPMVEHYEKMLLDMGFDEEQIKRDYFPNYEWPLR